MLKLYGFIQSSYYNVVKLTLLEKGLPFEEVLVPLGEQGKLVPGAGYREKSPIAKVPCLETDQGFLSETSVIIDYLEGLGTGPSFYPADPFERAKVRELIKYMELYIELPARRLYGELAGRPVSDSEKQTVRVLLEEGFAALVRLARFDPYVAGKEITYADFFAYYNLPNATWTTKTVYAWDTYRTTPGLKDLIDLMGRRQTVRRIKADRNAESG
jgi:glutathione S-transferase